MLINYNTSTRPTRNRLLTAIGVSTCVIALSLASLELLFEFMPSISRAEIEHVDPLTVLIQNDAREEIQDVAALDVDDALPQEQDIATESAVLPQEVTSEQPAESPGEADTTTNWYALADKAAKSTVHEQFKQEESRASMWQETRSMMFKPGGETVLKEEEPILSDVRFKYHSRVLGLGINIGSCFIGLPVAGVPVEKRSTAITVFVCG